MNNAPATTASLSTCWNHIGTRGDGTCPQLLQHTRCLNCPTYAAAATIILDAAPLSLDLAYGRQNFQHDADQRNTNRHSVLIFRVGIEWLALHTDVIVEVTEQQTIHSLPHQASPAILGLSNIRGGLVPCISLSHMLQGGQASPPDSRNTPRFLVIQHQSRKIVLPVDEVHGVERFPDTAIQPVPSTFGHTGAHCTQAILSWRESSIGLLDCSLLFHVLHRSLA